MPTTDKANKEAGPSRKPQLEETDYGIGTGSPMSEMFHTFRSMPSCQSGGLTVQQMPEIEPTLCLGPEGGRKIEIQ